MRANCKSSIRIINPSPSATKSCKQWGHRALALAIMLGLAAMAPSAQAQTFTSLYSFAGGADGNQPGGLVRDKAGNLYGSTTVGGGGPCESRAGCGTVFKLDVNNNETVLYAFTGGKDGALPAPYLVLDSAGNLFGTTIEGGNIYCGLSSGCGTVFKLDPSAHETVLYDFIKSTSGSSPNGVTQGATGTLYGTTQYGGEYPGSGSVFQLGLTGKETVLHVFAGGADGSLPYTGVIRDKAGNLMGVTSEGGRLGYGTIFKVESTGAETVLHAFDESDGEAPLGGLLQNGEYLYGTTSTAGESGCFSCGTVFKLDKAGNFTVVYNFSGGSDGGRPTGNLVHDAAGILYGTTVYGGTFGYGTVFKLDPTTGQETVLYSFTGGVDGLFPSSGVILDAAGNLYGTTLLGGTFFSGTVFKIVP